ncbi:hypothetical protein MIND_00712700 [Mycena indigotica]|uniref:DUF6534 domain-containing protein n=1 Tax=Mycena indigotica TaxID=2126181 RepID=A0A8H6W4H7_9AGAR|nr:uncharacterized protein MIND_00712700 [Mycena indigotica]KAF7301473.1 hypothetical protein MIND_00712700 [Mycena indigotica]
MSAALLKAENDAVIQLYATSLIGFAVATTIYGISVLQVYLYYRAYPKDRLALKLTVALLFAVDTCGTMFVCHSLYTYHVFNYYTPLKSLEIPWSFAVEKFLVTFTTFVAQCFYAHTIYKATSHRLTSAFIMALALAALALGCWTTEQIFDKPLAVVSTHKFAVISACVQSFAALDDVVITASLCYYLRRRRGDLPSTNGLLDTLMVYAVSRGALTAIAQILFLITNVGFPGRTYWQPFHQVVGKLYVNSVLATLNVRSTFAVRSEVQLNTLKLTVPGGSAAIESRAEDGRLKPITFKHPITSATTDSSTAGDASDKAETSFP